MLAKELGFGAPGATLLHTDNLATLQGTGMEQVPLAQRYMGARRDILRSAKEGGRVELQSVDTSDNLADMMTKPLPRDKFVALRALLLGIRPVPEGPEGGQKNPPVRCDFRQLRGVHTTPSSHQPLACLTPTRPRYR